MITWIRVTSIVLALGLVNPVTHAVANPEEPTLTPQQLTPQHKAALDKWGIDPDKALSWAKQQTESQDLAWRFLESIAEGDEAVARFFLDEKLLPSQLTQMAEALQADKDRIDQMVTLLGDTVAKEHEKRSAGWGDFQARLVLSNDKVSDQKNNKIVYVKSLEQADSGDLSLSIIEAPVRMKDTAMLTKINLDKPDDQWVYLPKSKRIKKITLNNKSSSFLGTEFSFEDLSIFDIRKYHTVFDGETTCDVGSCFKVVLKPKKASKNDRELVALINAKTYAPLKIDYFRGNSAHFKTLEFHDYKQYQGKFWRPRLMVMKNLESGKSSTMEWQSLEFGTGLNSKDFTKAALKRAGR